MPKRVAPFLIASLVVGGFASPAAAQEKVEARPPVVIPRVPTVEIRTGPPEATSSNVPLTGAGKLHAPLDAAGLAYGLTIPARPMELGVEVWFGKDGKPTRCQNALSTNLRENGGGAHVIAYRVLRELICEQAMQDWSFELYDWYGAEVDRGFVTAHFRITPTVKLYAPVTPAGIFNPGANIRVDYWVREGEDPTCNVRTALVDPAQAEAICDLVKSDPEKHLMPLKDERPTPFRTTKPLVIDWEQTILRVERKPSFKVKDFGSVVYRRLDRDLPEGSVQDMSEIGFESRLSPNDNPAWRQSDYRWTGRTLSLLGIDDRGRVQTCVPLETSGSAHVDNGVCAAMVRKSRAAKGKAPAGQQYRYVVAPALWKPAR